MLILLTGVGTQQMTHFLEIEYLHLVVSDCVCIALSFKGGCRWLLGTAGQKMVMSPYSPFTCFIPGTPYRLSWATICFHQKQSKRKFANSFLKLKEFISDRTALSIWLHHGFISVQNTFLYHSILALITLTARTVCKKWDSVVPWYHWKQEKDTLSQYMEM